MDRQDYTWRHANGLISTRHLRLKWVAIGGLYTGNSHAHCAHIHCSRYRDRSSHGDASTSSDAATSNKSDASTSISDDHHVVPG